jgi:hypothetical protein
MPEQSDVDVSPRDLISWVRADQGQRSPALWASASKTVEKTDLDLETAGVTLDDDVAETSTRGMLEVQPRRGQGGWVLRISVVDTAGEHPVGDEEVEEKVEELTLDAFEEEFLQPEGLVADITVSVDDARAKARFGRWLSRMRPRAQPKQGRARLPARRAP